MENNKQQTPLPIEQQLEEIASSLKTVEEWKNYIDSYYPSFCSILAKLEAKNNKTNSNNQKPIAVITGGQPGAGKSALILTYSKKLKNDYNIDAILNNADFYRFCVPGSYKLAISHPEKASELTDPVVKQMRQNLMEEAISQKQSIIVENTLGDTIAVDAMRKQNTHDIWIALMAVPREESLLSDFERYIKTKEDCGIARLVTVEAHDKRYYALDKIAPELENSGLRTLVHSRGKTEYSPAIIEYDSTDNNKKYPNVTEALNSIRAKFTLKHSHTYKERLNHIREAMEKYGMTPDEAEQLNKLEEIIEQYLLKSEGR